MKELKKALVTSLLLPMQKHIVEVNAQKQVLGENSRDFETGDIDIYDAEDAEGDEDGISFTSTYVKWFVELYKVKAKEAK
ncbi:hypothetical protein FIBSPDRAFT_862477 [Athelia psychrophila]|uniref:Uncharacterized protein n=1 Tax=Athelia psychrophila TaxID=1759441 RepID=A0A166IG41_9AGAM|nr:hypothetical protein FIBSPDRAFT_862477 [Fibularhizoctonia sp. CBS 109695]